MCDYSSIAVGHCVQFIIVGTRASMRNTDVPMVIHTYTNVHMVIHTYTDVHMMIRAYTDVHMMIHTYTDKCRQTYSHHHQLEGYYQLTQGQGHSYEMTQLSQFVLLHSPWKLQNKLNSLEN